MPPSSSQWIERLEENHDNLRAALKWSLENGDVELSARFSGALSPFWGLRGYLFEGRLWLEQVIALFEYRPRRCCDPGKSIPGRRYAGLAAE